jgi:uncharacterized protein YjiS (DUF1127 family)
MSCASTACTTKHEIPASRPFAGFERLWQGPSRWLAQISRGYERRSQRRQLLELDGRLPADIGLSREDAVDEASKSSIRVILWRIHQ